MIQINITQDLTAELITLEEAKEYLGIDFDEYDTMIGNLIISARISSEKVTGKAYGIKTIQITGNTYTDNTGEVVKVYPITPIATASIDVSNENYTYQAGYSTLPKDLKMAMLMRIGTAFASRQDNAGGDKSVNASIIIERQYVSQLGA